mmetsp:Transcript_3368/g.4986  ORF Transcript_3368/g.4986 Transcript_3368/m.4986 type:complete len:167 (-) Transcript_3368:193-693(-)|eukprot:CAMPEP_0172415706 /NCGR_PEP_ID=MMETSP1064-20121228/2127_1 /TAXON_ID=202472 /ORGANISM="Aulacoseira subarctica , Strain CCAP 1002/5" /LENGTH=166 /DNA_ID=CAMNT_0013152865 /DNA_START=107 /DNA_END=607 /DNA_ORIENTATION=-
MKLTISVPCLLLLAVSTANAFSFSKSSFQSTRHSTTELSLFGGKKADGSKPGFMDQMAMLKKAQEVAMKKVAIDKELSQLSFVGEAASGKVKVTVKYIPPQPQQHPYPGYEGTAVDIEEAYLQNSGADELGEALTEALSDAYKKCQLEVSTKMQEFALQFQEMMKA